MIKLLSSFNPLHNLFYTQFTQNLFCDLIPLIYYLAPPFNSLGIVLRHAFTTTIAGLKGPR